jgi:NADPH:quinone reductase-like Zn-dependent oxidoreductase
MKAIHLTAYGNPTQNLKMVEVPEPNTPSAGEALVRMEYAPIDYSDLLLAQGVYHLKPKLPSVIGGEGTGIVEGIGPRVTSVKVGDHVTIPFKTFSWAEKVLAPADGLFVVPSSVDPKAASMLKHQSHYGSPSFRRICKTKVQRLDRAQCGKFASCAMRHRNCKIARP